MKKKNRFNITFKKNSFDITKNGTVTFKKPLTITDNQEQWNGTKYDIKSMDISGFNKKLTADHSQDIKKVLGGVSGIRKVASRRVTIDSIQFAVEENALAVYALNMLKAGFLTDFSIETIGKWPDEDGIYFDSNLVGLSLVVAGNNKSAKINELAKNSIKEAKELGLDTALVENKYLCYPKNKENKIINNKEINKMLILVKNTRSFSVKIQYVNKKGEIVGKTLKPGKSIKLAKKQANLVKAQIKEAKKPKSKSVNKAMKKAVQSAMKPLQAKIKDLEKQAFDNGAKEPQFRKDDKAGKLSDMDHEQILDKQINGFLDHKMRGSMLGLTALNDCNALNLERLKDEGMVKNQMTIADFGNFVISPELLTEIQGFRTSFADFLSKFSFKETLSQQMAWLERSGDIDMTSVEFCDDGADGNLKPISEYTAAQRTANLEELAAVTPVCNAATRFLAVDMIADVTQGYSLDYDRKKAQLIIARLQQAVDFTGFKNPYDGTSSTTRLTSFVDALARVSESVENGWWIMNEKTRLEIVRRAIEAGISGPLSLTLMSGNMEPLLGKNYLITPNELLPTLNSAETKSFTVDGAAVTINQAVFYADPMWFKGRISGGLKFDLSTEAAYEIDGAVRSAFQRNELVLRGSFFRNGAITDRSRVSSMYAAGVS